MAGTAVLTRSYDNARTGSCTSETTLTPAAVLGRGLKRVRSFAVDDDPRIEAQPLYVPGIRMPDGKAHDVLFVATMGNHVWAFDVNGDGVWKTPQLGTPFTPKETQKPGHHRSTTIDAWGINISWGILSTPVIDLDAGRMYLVNWMLQRSGKPALFAHRIDLSTMTEVGAPEPITAQQSDPGRPSTTVQGKPVTLQPDQRQRAALLLVPLRGLHKTLFVCTAGGENPGAPHGWMVAFDVDTFKQTASWVSTPSSFGGGMWQASQGPAADEKGNVYAITGNGGYVTDHKDKIRDFNGDTDFAEAVVKLAYEKQGNGHRLTLSDWFIPFRDSDRNTIERTSHCAPGSWTRTRVRLPSSRVAPRWPRRRRRPARPALAVCLARCWRSRPTASRWTPASYGRSPRLTATRTVTWSRASPAPTTQSTWTRIRSICRRRG